MNEVWLLGQIFIEKGWITWAQFEEGLRIQKERRVKGKVPFIGSPPVLLIGEILVKRRALTWDKLNTALLAQKTSGRILGDILVSRGFIQEKDLYQALAEQANWAYVELEAVKITTDALSVISKSLAEDLNILPLVKQKAQVLVAVSDMGDLRVDVELRKRVPHREIRYVLAAPSDIRKAIQKNYP